MMIFFEIPHGAVANGLNRDGAHTKMQTACFLLVGLLSIAGFHGEGCRLFEDKDATRFCQEGLKPQFKSRKNAMRAVVAATMAPSVEKYHALLFSYELDGHEILKIMDPTANLDEAKASFLKDQKERNKSSSRSTIGGGGRNTTFMCLDLCNSCTKSFQHIEECPCQTAEYCSKECQIAHWKIHKRVCPNRKRG
jgi:hypothetical protein